MVLSKTCQEESKVECLLMTQQNSVRSNDIKGAKKIIVEAANVINILRYLRIVVPSSWNLV